MTQPLSTWGPPTTPPLAAPAPLVVPLAPRRGWARADTGRRSAAVLALPFGFVVCAATAVGTERELLLLWVSPLWLAVGPVTFYSLARVLRPEPRSPDRTPRHVLAGAATAYAVPVLADALSDGEGSVVIVLGTAAAVLGILTLAWGLVAFLVRLAHR